MCSTFKLLAVAGVLARVDRGEESLGRRVEFSREDVVSYSPVTGARTGFPRGWRVGDKTGTSDNAVSNDIAIAWPPGRAPLLVTAYFAETPAGADTRNAVIAEVGRIAAAAVEQSTRPGA